MQPDAVDRILAQWARQRPDLDVGAMGLIGRLHRLATLLDTELRPVFAEAGLGEGEFDVLATLRRCHPEPLTPGELSQRQMVTGSAITKRVDRLVDRGLASREPGPRDARSREIRLTDAGLALVDAAVERHVANEERLVATFTPPQREHLAALLRQWLLALEGPATDEPPRD